MKTEMSGCSQKKAKLGVHLKVIGFPLVSKSQHKTMFCLGSFSVEKDFFKIVHHYNVLEMYKLPRIVLFMFNIYFVFTCGKATEAS